MDLEFLGDSSCISSAGYQAGYLTIEFTDGKIYTYSDVHPFTWAGLLRSTSRGYFFNRNIRDKYPAFEGGPPEGSLVDKASDTLEQILGPEYLID